MADFVANQRFAALAPVPLTSSGGPTDPTIVRLASGGFIAAWEASGGFSAQIFDRQGAAIGNIFSLQSPTNTNFKDVLAIAPLPSGGFAAAWHSSTGSGVGVEVRLFDAGGTPLGAETFLNGVNDVKPRMAALAGGGVVVTYSGDNAGIVAQFLDSSGAKSGAEIDVQTPPPPPFPNAPPPQPPGDSLVTGLGNGGFVVAWIDSSDLDAQIFDASGQKVGGQLDLVSHMGSTSLATLANGNFIVAYAQFGGYLKAKIFSPAGALVVAEFDLATPAMASIPGLPSVVPLESGDFVVTWQDSNSGSGDVNVKGQLFNAAGTRIGSAFTVNAQTAGTQYKPVSTSFGSGDVATLWIDQASSRADLRLLFSAQFGTEGNDGITGSSDRDFVYGLGGDDVVSTGAAVDEIEGGEGNDFLSGGAGADILFGGLGDDTYFVYAADSATFEDIIIENPGSGFDQIRTTLPVFTLAGLPEFEALMGIANISFTLTGNSGDNYIIGNASADTLNGGFGNDRLEGLGDNDTMRGGPGDDEYVVDDAGDILEENAGEGTDAVFTGLATYSLFGSQIENLFGTGNIGQNLRGSAGNNLIVSGDFNDTFLLQDGGEDEAAGGGGNDVFYFGSGLSAGDVADGGGGRDAIVLQGNVTAALSGTNLVGIESISIQSGANTRFGDTANNFYDYSVATADGSVLPGQQLIVNAQSLRAGEDFTFDGSAESDGKFVVYGGHGVDDLTGGDGVDVFFFEGQRWGPDDRVDGGGGRDSLVISAGSGLTHIEFAADSFTNIESISLNNRFATDPSQKPSYELVLHNGNVSPGGTLIVNGSSIPGGQLVSIDARGVHDGKLILFGGGGHDTLFGGDGADLIIGSGGADALTGGSGADTFRYDSVSDSAGFADLIGDFQTGSDRIDLSRIDADSTTAGDQAFTWIGANAFNGVAGELRTYEADGYKWVAGDTDGDGDADIAIAFQIGIPTLVQGDFLL